MFAAILVTSVLSLTLYAAGGAHPPARDPVGAGCPARDRHRGPAVLGCPPGPVASAGAASWPLHPLAEQPQRPRASRAATRTAARPPSRSAPPPRWRRRSSPTSSASERTISHGAACAAAIRPSIMNGLVSGTRARVATQPASLSISPIELYTPDQVAGRGDQGQGHHDGVHVLGPADERARGREQRGEQQEPEHAVRREQQQQPGRQALGQRRRPCPGDHRGHRVLEQRATRAPPPRRPRTA